MSPRKARRKTAALPGRTWWGRRWLDLLERVVPAGALEAGRVLARTAPLPEVDVDGARVTFRGVPLCEAWLFWTALPARSIPKAARELAARARFAARLLSGTLPEEADEVFAAAGHPLLPSAPEEVGIRCSCDPEGRCAHAAALGILLAERLDAEPFLVFAMRGTTREALLTALETARSFPEGKGATSAAGPRPLPRSPLPVVDPEEFYRPLLPLATLRTTFAPPEHAEAVLTGLGASPLDEPEAARLLQDFHRAIGRGAAERLSEWEWKRVFRPNRKA